MPTGRGSHRWCSVCHARWIDKSKHKNMCKVCYRKWADRVRKERADIKRRRAARQAAQNGVHSMTESQSPPTSQPVPEATPNGQVKPKHPGGRIPQGGRLTQEQELEIVRLYQTTDDPVSEIARAFGVHPTYPYAILERRQIPRTRQDRQARQAKAKPQPVAVEDVLQPPPVPEPVDKALERMLAPQPEPLASYQERRRPRPSQAPTERWQVLVEGWIDIDAEGLEQVVVEIRARYPGLTVTQLRREP